MASNKLDVYNAYLSNDMEKWKQTIDKMNIAKIKQDVYILELLNYQYGYIAWCVGNQMEDEAKKYLGLAERNIELLEKINNNLSLLYAYKAAFLGFRIGLDLYKAPFLGPKSAEYVRLALQKDEHNWFAHMQYANIQFYMPSVFGGSKTKAIRGYLKAKDLMEKNNDLSLNNWNYLNLLVTIANAYHDISNLNNTKYYYQKILSIEPEFIWVKDELYPDLINRINNHFDE